MPAMCDLNQGWMHGLTSLWSGMTGYVACHDCQCDNFDILGSYIIMIMSFQLLQLAYVAAAAGPDGDA
jgi:hypothetical protein